MHGIQFHAGVMAMKCVTKEVSRILPSNLFICILVETSSIMALDRILYVNEVFPYFTNV